VTAPVVSPSRCYHLILLSALGGPSTRWVLSTADSLLCTFLSGLSLTPFSSLQDHLPSRATPQLRFRLGDLLFFPAFTLLSGRQRPLAGPEPRRRLRPGRCSDFFASPRLCFLADVRHAPGPTEFTLLRPCLGYCFPPAVFFLFHLLMGCVFSSGFFLGVVLTRPRGEELYFLGPPRLFPPILSNPDLTPDLPPLISDQIHCGLFGMLTSIPWLLPFSPLF